MRLPPDLKAKLQHAAIDGNRSMNAEILSRLERSFEPDPLAEIAGFLRATSAVGEADQARIMDMLTQIAGLIRAAPDKRRS